MEIAPGIHRLESRIGPRYLFQHILIGERVLLVDSGMAQTPETLIFPYLRSLGRDPSQIDYVLITHPDCDHFGGNAAIRKAASGAVIFCACSDRQMIESPDVLLSDRYGHYEADHEIAYPPDDKKWLRDVAGEATPVDVTVDGGEEIHLGENWRVRVLFTPGHALGHLSVLDERSSTAIIGDAVLWRGLPDVDGRLTLPPSYILPAAYLATIQSLENLPLKRLLTSHYRSFEGEKIRTFLAESREFCRRSERQLLALLERSKTPLSLKEIIGALNSLLGPFPPPHERDLAYPLYGHLNELVKSSRVEEHRDSVPVRFSVRKSAP